MVLNPPREAPGIVATAAHFLYIATMAGHDSEKPGDADLALASVHAGFCAILGLPNVGKSTLVNRVLGLRLVAVSRKPQTTRNRILGVHNTALGSADEIAGEVHRAAERAEPRSGQAQIIFVDTPGIQRGPGALRRYMRDQSLGAVGDSDVVLILVDAGDPAQHDSARLRQPDTRALIKALDRVKSPAIVAINKIDLLDRPERLLPIIASYAETGMFAEVVPISAKTGNGVDRLVTLVARSLPLGPQLFPDDMVTDRAERFLAGELIREQLFRQLGQELPYATAVVVESFHERVQQGDVVIDAVIYVERNSQKGMVVGKGGRRIKMVGSRARQAISQLLGCEVHVKLHVKVASAWSRVDAGIRRMGYE